MAFEQATMRVSPAAHQRVTAIKKIMEAAERRSVTYSEVLDKLAEHWTASFVEEMRDSR